MDQVVTLEEKIRGLMDNEQFLKQMAASQTPAEIRNAFHQFGFEITEDEASQMREQVLSNDGELSEDMLEQASGGFISLAVGAAAAAAGIGGIAVGAVSYTHLRRRRCTPGDRSAR